MKNRAKFTVIAVGLLTLVLALYLQNARAVQAKTPPGVPDNGVPFVLGNVMAAVGNGSVKHFTPIGTLLDTLVGGTGSSYTTGMAFDVAGNLYVTTFSSGTVDKYDIGGNFLGAFISGLSGAPESLAFDALGNLYVGGPVMSVFKYDPAGNFLASFGTGRSDWIDLAADQCTIIYTDEGVVIKRFNVCTNTPLPNFATLPGGAFALRIRPNGEVIVAASGAAYQLDSTGAILQTYTIPGASLLFGMNLDPDNTTFWTGDLNTGVINRVNIATGAIVTTYNSAPFTSLAGLAVIGEIRVADPTPTPTPEPTLTPTPPPVPTPTPGGTPHPHHVTPTPRPHVTPTPRPPHATPTPHPGHGTPTPTPGRPAE